MIDTKDIPLVYDPIFKMENGELFIQGRKLSAQEVSDLASSMKGYKDSLARHVIRDQLKWLAINQGIHDCTSTEQLMFAKAALWIINQEDKLISSF